MSVESTKATMERYFNAAHDDVSMLADNVLFTIMDSGETYRGPQAVPGMLEDFYQKAFEAKTETRNILYADGQAVGEWDFVGKHVGEFVGIPASGKSVRVPLCVVYQVENDKITQGRVYFQMASLLRQLGV